MPVNIDDPKIFLPAKEKVLRSMEELIHQFMIVTEGFHCPAGEIYVATEVPKGELGFYIVSEGGKSPYRCRIRSSAFNNLASLKHQVEGELVADVVACIGSSCPFTITRCRPAMSPIARTSMRSIEESTKREVPLVVSSSPSTCQGSIALRTSRRTSDVRVNEA